MKRLEVSAAVRHIYMSLGFKRLKHGVDEYKSNIIGQDRKLVKIYDNYTADFCDRSNGPENQKSNINRK